MALMRRSQDVFDGLADTWWDRDGALHGIGELLDRVRVPFVEETLRGELGAGKLRVLDVGGGGGRLAARVAERGHYVVTLDPSLRSLRAGRRHTTAVGLDDISYVGGSGERLPFEPRSFDAVLCMEVLEHVSDPGAVICEAARVLRPGGVFVFSGPNRTLPTRLGLVLGAQQILGLIPRGTHRFERLLRPDEIESMMHAARIEPTLTAGVGLRWRDVPLGAVALAGLLTRRFTHAQAGRRMRLSSGGRTTVAFQGYGVRASGRG